ncbi:MAG: hypothetical protein KatS3mg091_081 [Patescibacteria group bacterium]|nr:MAG: hypothetical protein KatS3mg091_081 [Patescibacteria group bacterium]
MNSNSKNLLVLPVFFYFLISLKQFYFYENNFGKILNYVNLKDNNLYEQIQGQHPYWELYQITKDSQKNNKKIYTIFFDQNEKFLDETSTLLLHKYKPELKNKDIKVYLTEPEVYLNYFMYPNLPKEISINDILTSKLEKGAYLISDKDVLLLYPQSKKFLNRISIKSEKDYILVNRRVEEYQFFVFYVK